MEYRFTKLANFKNINIGFLHASDLGFFFFFFAKLAFKSENLFHFRICKFKEVEVLTFITQALSSLNFTITSESFCIQKKILLFILLVL